MKEVIISVDSKGGGASIRRMQAVATKKLKKLYCFQQAISYGLVDLSTYNGKQEYRYRYEVN